MTLIKCKACNKRYDYHEHGCCPGCGAYNRPPQRNRVGSDGVVHRMSDADFFNNTAKRRSSQNGKVCFEQDVCFEDQARKVRGGAESPFTTKRSEKTRGKNSSVAKIIKVAIAVIVICNILPLSLTMCSVSGVFEDIVDELFGSEVSWDVPVEVPVDTVPAQPDLTGAELIDFGQSFPWGEEMARVTGAGVHEGKKQTTVDLAVSVHDPVDKPRVFYVQPDGLLAAAICTDAILINDGIYTYCFELPDRQPGSAVYALFTGQSDGEWHTYQLPLN